MKQIFRVDNLTCTPKKSTDNHLRSHLTAIMALDHSRLGVENKFLENKSGRIFTFDKFTLQNLANKSGCVQTNLLYFLYITSEVKEYYEVLFLYRPQTISSQSHNFSRQIAFIQYSGPSKHTWAFSETVQKMCKITYVASQAVFVTRFNQSECIICRVIFALGKGCFQKHMW